ncbi:restriction endonuclease subunit S [Mammaliicoccus sciuri]|uniref:restriction endonuclease subunit S n=1 Tax=Mammaliicoccus sciuri TaxID=1296 RepID=UPI000E6A45C2|nr:restriction endonuclease subunit S [Mammaliicoccus sciuri]RIN84217.1 restriction endonuclease subunit S [Mammaliicoccus sciuri]
MTNELKNVPELRFPEFDGEWEINIFDDMVSNKSSKYSPNNDESIIDIELDSIQSNTGRLIKSYTSNEFSSQKNVFKKNQVLYSKLRPYLNKYHFPKFDGVCTSEIWVLDSKNKSILSNEFLYYFIQTSKFSEVTNKSAGSKMPRADWNLVGDLRLNIASIKEQDKIIRFFSKLDRQIELEEQKLAKLEEQKKGYMQKIFSQELRFKDENGNEYPEWEEKFISDIGKVVTGNTPSKKENKYWDTNQYVWITPTDISKEKNICNSNYQLSEKGFEKSRQLPKNTLLITCIASIGKNAILRTEGSCNQQINAVIPNDNYDVDYLYYAFEDVSKLMKRIAGKTATQIVNKAVFEKLSINIPSFNEQKRISGFLSKVEIFIDRQNLKIDGLKSRKQGLLQKMFV